MTRVQDRRARMNLQDGSPVTNVPAALPVAAVPGVARAGGLDKTCGGFIGKILI